jgi:hypothetical protein
VNRPIVNRVKIPPSTEAVATSTSSMCRVRYSRMFSRCSGEITVVSNASRVKSLSLSTYWGEIVDDLVRLPGQDRGQPDGEQDHRKQHGQQEKRGGAPAPPSAPLLQPITAGSSATHSIVAITRYRTSSRTWPRNHRAAILSRTPPIAHMMPCLMALETQGGGVSPVAGPTDAFGTRLVWSSIALLPRIGCHASLARWVRRAPSEIVGARSNGLEGRSRGDAEATGFEPVRGGLGP